jgi:hypothetical protein
MAVMHTGNKHPRSTRTGFHAMIEEVANIFGEAAVRERGRQSQKQV